jgi:hypothetical protein
MFCTSLAKEEGPFVLDSVFRWSLGDCFPFGLLRGACAARAPSALATPEVVLVASAAFASAAFLRTAASNAEEECTEGRLRAAPVGANAEAEATEGTEAGAEEFFFAGPFSVCIGAAFNFEFEFDVDDEGRSGFVRSITDAAGCDDLNLNAGAAVGAVAAAAAGFRLAANLR